MEFSSYFGIVLTLLTFISASFIQKKTKIIIFNPILISVICVIALLLMFHIPYETYQQSAQYISYLLTPATISLALPLYKQIYLLKENIKAILLGIVAGVLSSLSSVYLFALLFAFTHQEYATFLPKSITTAIGMGISEELGGIVSLTVASIIITGIIGNISATYILKLFHIKEPIAKGLAIGCASHAIGTSKAMEIGEIEGAMSSLAIVLSGLITVLLANIFILLL